jgi:hypothetical protein
VPVLTNIEAQGAGKVAPKVANILRPDSPTKPQRARRKRRARLSFLNTATTSLAAVLATLALQEELGVSAVGPGLALLPLSMGVVPVRR